MEVYRKGRLTLANAPGSGRGRRQGHLYLCAGHHPVLSGRGTHPAQRALLCLLGALAEEIRAGEPGEPGRQGRQPVGRLRHAGGPPLDPEGTKEVRRADPEESAGLHRPAHPLPFPRAHHRGRPFRGAPCRNRLL